MNFCANCGGELQAAARFCPNCGQSVTGQLAATLPPATPPPAAPAPAAPPPAAPKPNPARTRPAALRLSINQDGELQMGDEANPVRWVFTPQQTKQLGYFLRQTHDVWNPF